MYPVPVPECSPEIAFRWTVLAFFALAGPQPEVAFILQSAACGRAAFRLREIVPQYDDSGRETDR